MEAYQVAAPTKCAVDSSAELPRRHREAGMLHGAIAILAVAVGIFDVGGNPAAAISHGVLQEIHPLFGLLLLAFVISKFYSHERHSPGVRLDELREFSRHVVRTVFLLVYLVVFTKEALVVLGPQTLRAGELGSHLGGYVACGAVALVTVRLLAGLLARTRSI